MLVKPFLLLCLSAAATLFFFSLYREGEASVSFDPEAIQAVYINLDSRTDRKEQIKNELSPHFSMHRMSAVKVLPQPGVQECWGNAYCASQVGCQLSHMRALKYAQTIEAKSVLLFEDDFQWSHDVNPTYVKRLLTSITKTYTNWDVIALSLNILDYKDTRPALQVHTSFSTKSRVIRIIEAQATHAYLIRASYIPEVYEAFKNCDILSSPLIAIDVCWKQLQKTGNWYGFKPQLGTQRKGFSDIENMNVNYHIA